MNAYTYLRAECDRLDRRLRSVKEAAEGGLSVRSAALALHEMDPGRSIRWYQLMIKDAQKSE